MANRRWRRVRVDGRGYLWLAERGRGTRRRLRLGRRGSGYWKGNAIGRGDVDNVASASARSASFEEGVSFRIIFSSKESAATKVERVETIPFRSPTNKSLTSRLLSSPSSWTVLVLNPPQPHSYQPQQSATYTRYPCYPFTMKLDRPQIAPPHHHLSRRQARQNFHKDIIHLLFAKNPMNQLARPIAQSTVSLSPHHNAT